MKNRLWFLCTFIIFLISCAEVDPNGTFIIENNSDYSFTLIEIYYFIGDYNSADDRFHPEKGALVIDLESLDKLSTVSCVLHDGYYVIEIKREGKEPITNTLFRDPITFPVKKGETTTMEIYNNSFDIWHTVTRK